MKSLIYVKYGDLNLKGKNKPEFINKLFSNIKWALNDFKAKIVKEFDNIKIFCETKQQQQIIDILMFVPGILYIIKAVEVKTEIEMIKEAVLGFCKDNSTFKVEVKRKFKNFLEQQEIKKIMAGHIFNNFNNMKVDVHNPDILIWIEIKEKESIIYTNKINGIGGFPIGSNGSCLSLISGGIDSCVSSFLLQKKGVQIDYLTFITNEVTEITISKIKKLIDKISVNKKIYKSKLYVVDFTEIQKELSHAKDEKYRITLMRRSFYKMAEKIAEKYNIDSLCSGDSLGQVASQTMESINAINNVMRNKIIFRPLLTYDKNDIIKIANHIDTYELSISEHEDICSLFAPKNPSTKPNLDKVIKNEEELFLLSSLEDKAIENLKIIE